MRHLPTLAWFELRTLLATHSTYLACILALAMNGFLYLIMLMQLSLSTNDKGPNELFFSVFWLPALFMVPMLTMRSFAEERRMGTLETLQSAPLESAELVVAKFLAAYGFYALIWTLTLAYPFIAAMVLEPEASVHLLEQGSLAGGYLFVLLSGTLFVAVGILASTLTRSQFIAGMLSFSILFLLVIGIAALRIASVELDALGFLDPQSLEYLQVFTHYEDFVRGVLDTRPVAYYLSGTFLVLALAVVALEE